MNATRVAPGRFATSSVSIADAGSDVCCGNTAIDSGTDAQITANCAASSTPGSLWSDRVSSSILVYWGSNVPMALSAVYKEWRFSSSPSSDDVHVMYLTQ